MVPKDRVHNNQLGYRKGWNTSLCCSFLKYILSYFTDGQSLVFVCSLDTEEYFDLFWHNGPLWNILPNVHWLFLYQWYAKLQGLIRWSGDFSYHFSVTLCKVYPVIFYTKTKELIKTLTWKPWKSIS